MRLPETEDRESAGQGGEAKGEVVAYGWGMRTGAVAARFPGGGGRGWPPRCRGG